MLTSCGKEPIYPLPDAHLVAGNLAAAKLYLGCLLVIFWLSSAEPWPRDFPTFGAKKKVRKYFNFC
jgi:hypothetical protein